MYSLLVRCLLISEFCLTPLWSSFATRSSAARLSNDSEYFAGIGFLSISFSLAGFRLRANRHRARAGLRRLIR